LVCLSLGLELRAIPHDSKPQSIERTRVRAKHVKTATKPAQTPKLALPLSHRRNVLPKRKLIPWSGLCVKTKVRGFAFF
jgi:hypothetical protein